MTRPQSDTPRLARLRALSRRGGTRDFSQLAGRGLVLQAILLVSGPIVARLLGPEGRGELALAMTVGLMFAQAFAGGIGVAVAHAVAGTGAPARAMLRPHLARWLGYGTGAAVLAAVTTAVLLAREESTQVVGLTVAAAGIATLSIANQLLGAMMRGEGDVRGVTVIPVIMTTTYVCAVVVCWLFLPGTPAAAVAGLYIASQALAVLLTWRRLSRPDDSPDADRRSLANMARRSWATAVNTLGLGFDQLVVVLLLGTHALGLYTVAVSITNVSAMALRSVASMLMPRLVAAPPEVRPAMTRRWLAAAAGLDLLIVVGLEVVIGPVIRWLFGTEFTPATTTARIMIIGWGFLAFRLLLTAVLQSRGQAGRASIVEMASTVVLVVTAYAGATLAGIEGVATAMLVTAVVACALAGWQLRTTPDETAPREAAGGAS